MKKLSTNYILRRLSELQVLSFRDVEFQRLFQLSRPQTYQVLHRLAAGGYLERLAQGRYVVLGWGGSPASGQPFYLGTRVVEPSYVSFWSAIHYYGWTEQAPRVVFIANTKASGLRRIGTFSFRFVRLRPFRFFGYASARDGTLEFPLAEPEKAIVDAFLVSQASGGFEVAASALGEALDGLEIPKLEEYARRVRVRSLASRLGYLLSASGIGTPALRRAASSVYVKLDPRGPRRGTFDARWKIIDNRREGA